MTGRRIIPLVKVSLMCPLVSTSTDGEKIYDGKRRYCVGCGQCMLCSPLGIGRLVMV